MLTDADKYFLKATLREHGRFFEATEWYLGWKPTPYQYGWHQVSRQLNTNWIAGIATGKTSGGAASLLMDCLSIPYFRGMVTSVTAKQANLSFDMMATWIEDNPRLEHLIEDVKLRPYASISFINKSLIEFRTAGTDARFIRGSEYDRIIFDEALLDPHGTIVGVLRGRLRGKRPDKTIRMARLDVISSPGDAIWLSERFYKGIKGHESYNPMHYSLRTATWDNPHLTHDQVELMRAEYSDEMIKVEMGGHFPEYGLSLFPRGHILACTDQSMNDLCWLALNEGDATPGWDYEEHPRHGVTKFEMPFDANGRYVMFGDPGTDDPPRRNAACVVVLDTSKSPKRVVYFDWVFGHGSYFPFLDSYKYALTKYSPEIRGIDSTGPQKMMTELAFEHKGIDVDGINFQRDKDAMINCLHTDITSHSMSWPNALGIRKQLSQYSRERDRNLPQDIVMTMAGASFLSRYAGSSDNKKKNTTNNFRNRRARTAVSRRR